MKFFWSILRNKFLAISFIIFCTFLFLKPSSGNTNTLLNDKVAHSIIFFGLFTTWNLSTRKPNLIFPVLLFYGICIEIIQYLLPISFHRGFEFYDIVADTFGLLIGYAIHFLIIKKRDLPK
jgi:VanZ family protein